jgi:hypothetical protein
VGYNCLEPFAAIRIAVGPASDALENRMQNGSKRTPSATWLRRRLGLAWAEMTAAVFCFHFALNNPQVMVRVVLTSLGIVLLAKAVADIIKKRKSTHSWPAAHDSIRTTRACRPR